MGKYLDNTKKILEYVPRLTGDNQRENFSIWYDKPWSLTSVNEIDDIPNSYYALLHFGSAGERVWFRIPHVTGGITTSPKRNLVRQWDYVRLKSIALYLKRRGEQCLS